MKFLQRRCSKRYRIKLERLCIKLIFSSHSFWWKYFGHASSSFEVLCAWVKQGMRELYTYVVACRNVLWLALLAQHVCSVYSKRNCSLLRTYVFGMISHLLRRLFLFYMKCCGTISNPRRHWKGCRYYFKPPSALFLTHAHLSALLHPFFRALKSNYKIENNSR